MMMGCQNSFQRNILLLYFLQHIFRLQRINNKRQRRSLVHNLKLQLSSTPSKGAAKLISGIGVPLSLIFFIYALSILLYCRLFSMSPSTFSRKSKFSPVNRVISCCRHLSVLVPPPFSDKA